MAETFMEGYRSIHNYALTGALSLVGSFGATLVALPPPGIVVDVQYSLGAYISYGIVAAAFIACLSGLRGFAIVFPAIFLNPISNAYVPLALQESQITLILLPLAGMIFLLMKNDMHRTALICLGVFAATAWMIKPSLIPVTISSLIILIMLARNIKTPRNIVAVSLLLFLAIIAPQCYVALEKFGTIFPFPQSDVLSFQLDYGYQVWKWETSLLDVGSEAQRATGRGLFTPFDPMQNSTYSDRIRNEPWVAYTLFIGHLIAAFDYTDLRVYITSSSDPIVSVNNIIFGSILFIFLYHIIQKSVNNRIDFSDLFLLCVAAGSSLALPFVAVETRFSLIPSIIASLYFLAHIRTTVSLSSQMVPAIAALLFGHVFAIAAFLLHQSARLV